jgi:uncharacterized protein with HEPN domain
LKRDIKLFVKDIISVMDSIEKFVSGMTIDELGKDDRTARAVIRKFEIIGEATTARSLRSEGLGWIFTLSTSNRAEQVLNC